MIPGNPNLPPSQCLPAPSSLGARFAPRPDHVPGVRFTRRPNRVPAGTVEGLPLNMGYKRRLRVCACGRSTGGRSCGPDPARGRPCARAWDQEWAPSSSPGPHLGRERAGRPAPCAGHGYGAGWETPLARGLADRFRVTCPQLGPQTRKWTRISFRPHLGPQARDGRGPTPRSHGWVTADEPLRL